MDDKIYLTIISLLLNLLVVGMGFWFRKWMNEKDDTDQRLKTRVAELEQHETARKIEIQQLTEISNSVQKLKNLFVRYIETTENGNARKILGELARND